MNTKKRFLFNSKDGSLSLKTRLGYKKKHALMNIFIAALISEDLVRNDLKRKVFDMSGLIDRNTSFGTPAEDAVDRVELKSLRFTFYKGNHWRRVTLEAVDKEEIYKMIDDLHVPTEQAEVTRVKMEVVFKKEDGQEKVKFEIIHPDTIKIGDSQYEPKIRQYIKDWGIDIGKDME